MQATEQSANTAEMVLPSCPAEFFSCMHLIEAQISAKTLEILRSRNWEGALTDQDWLFAEELVLEPVTVSSTLRSDGLLFRIAVPGFDAEDILLHIEGDLLCVCGYRREAQDQSRMFYARVAIPAGILGYPCAAWLSGSALHMALSREQVAPALRSSLPRTERAVAALAYATAV